MTRRPLPNVLVSIKSDPSVFCKTDTTGSFIIGSNVPQFDLSLHGYHVKTAKWTGTDTKVDTVFLSPFANSLAAVAVIGKKNLVTEKVDRIIYDVQNDPEARTQSVFEMMRKVPLISYDENDNMKLKGSTGFKVLIDGKPSALVVRNVESALKLMPASNVRSIEVYTIVPSRYESEGLGGLINIETIKRPVGGYSATAGGVIGNMNTSANANMIWKTGKLTVSASYGLFTEYPPRSTSFNYTSSRPDGLIIQRQSDSSRIRSSSNTAGLGITYEIDSLDLLNLSADGIWLSPDSRISLLNMKYDPAGNDRYLTNWLTRNIDQHDNAYSVNMNYQRGFKGAREHLLTFSASYLDRKNDFDAASVIRDPASHGDNGTIRQSNNEKFVEKAFQIDYTRPFKPLTAEVGIKYIHRDNESDNITLADSGYSATFPGAANDRNSFDYSMKILSVYNSYQASRKKLSLQAGVRYEFTWTNGLSRQNIYSVEQNYGRLVPSLALQRKLNQTQSMTLGYTQRIRRPSIWQLNPFVDKSDPAYYVSGNPFLRPVLSNDISLAFSRTKKGYTRLSMDYIFASNSIQRILVIDTDSITRSTFENIGKTRSANFNIYYSTNLSRRIDLNLSGELDYVWLTGMSGLNRVHNDGFQGNCYLYLTYSFDKGWKTSVNGGFYSPSVLLQGKSNTYFYNSLTVTRSFKKGLYTLAASVTNPFQEYRTVKRSLHVDEYSQYYESRNYNRNFSIRCFLNFGKLNKARLSSVKHKIGNTDTIEKENNVEKGKP